MNDVRSIASALGRQAIADKLGLTVNAVHEAVRHGRFPSAWWPALRDMGAERGLMIPEKLFNWREKV